MKRVLAVFLAFTLLTILCGCKCSHEWQAATCEKPGKCSKCGERSGWDELGHDYAPATFTSPATCRRCGQTDGSPLIPVAEWGFNNLADMDNSIVEITAYSISKWGGDCHVTVTGKTYLFENGYQLSKNFNIVDNECVFENTDALYSYKVVDNNNIDLGNGWTSLRITDRKTTEYRDDFVVFVSSGTDSIGLSWERWYVPYSLIDWERGPSLDPDSDPDNPEYIMYLKDIY